MSWGMRASVGLGTCCGFVSVSVQLQSKGKQSRIGDWTERRKAAIAIHGLGRCRSRGNRNCGGRERPFLLTEEKNEAASLSLPVSKEDCLT
ncbi:hypothetical protein BDA96_01G125900 [Sorghum bicolor]|uniref:Secreted protein n=1 Tax=Sorghum bicolor TaxID=4558 RepID=A0A921UXE6_SORBI|nr:hypothetical protein BDA96_01G125900 [Sorghum bicolor]